MVFQICISKLDDQLLVTTLALALGSCQAVGRTGAGKGSFRRASQALGFAALMAVIAAAAAVVALDLPDPQVMVHRPLDPDGVLWHHIILLKKCRQE